MNDTGMNTSIMTRVIEMMAPPISPIASIEALRALVAHIELGVHRLDHDYRVVDHNRDRKAREPRG